MVEPGQYTLEIQTASAWGKEKLERAVNVKADVKVLLVTDRPIYQPGHLIHLRALALRPFDMKPVAGKELQFEVEDPKGNKVFKRTLKTSEFGIASVDFQLADEVNMGDYHLRAFLGDERADKTVTVKRYVLPKFKVEVVSDKAFYLPKEKVKLEIQTDYFFGKPVAGSKIEDHGQHLRRAVPGVPKAARADRRQRPRQVRDSAARLLRRPAAAKGQRHRQNRREGDRHRRSCGDRGQILHRQRTADPGQPDSRERQAGPGDGEPHLRGRHHSRRPARRTAKVKLWLGKKAEGKPLRIAGNQRRGPGRISHHAQERAIPPVGPGAARSRNARRPPADFSAPTTFSISMPRPRTPRATRRPAWPSSTASRSAKTFLLRLDKAIYQTGDRLQMDIRTSAGMPTVFIDVVRGGQIMLSRWLEVKDGQAQQSIDLPPNLFGSLEIHAYQMLRHGEIIRDSRIAYVQPQERPQDRSEGREKRIPARRGSPHSLPGDR